MSSTFIRGLVERAVRTFVQAFLATMSVALPVIAATPNLSVSGARTALVSAAAAALASAISAVMTLVSRWFGGDPNSGSFLTTK